MHKAGNGALPQDMLGIIQCGDLCSSNIYELDLENATVTDT